MSAVTHLGCNRMFDSATDVTAQIDTFRRSDGTGWATIVRHATGTRGGMPTVNDWPTEDEARVGHRAVCIEVQRRMLAGEPINDGNPGDTIPVTS